ncbi:hypothetical protein ACQ5SK_02270 [Bradyrhizobium japonicum]
MPKVSAALELLALNVPVVAVKTSNAIVSSSSGPACTFKIGGVRTGVTGVMMSAP